MKTPVCYVLTAVILLLMPHVNFGQAPDLGTTSRFALFTAVGAFNNEGATTMVTGDVGTNVGAFNAFPPGTLIGEKHVADPASAQAATDVAIAYSDLSEVTCGQVISTTLGNGQILTPAVYCLGGAASLNGNLILDGGGDPNALFIFKIDGALSTSTFSNVILTNSANLCKVYWQINGQFELGDFSVFRGTVIANGPIILLEGSSLLGRGLSTAGAISLHSNVVTIGGVQPIASIITADGPTTFCEGGSVTLSGNNQGGTWSSGETTASITVSTSGEFFVKNTTGCGSATSNRITVAVNPRPVCTITGNNTVYTGDSTSLCGPEGYASYKWSTGATSRCITVTTAGTYTLTVTNQSGCESTCSKTVTATTPPSCTITGNSTFCKGSTTTLCAPEGCCKTTYQWSNGATTRCITVSQAGTYSLLYTNARGVKSTCSKAVTETAAPSCLITGSSTVCQGSTISLSAPSGYSAYQWSNGATTRSINVTSPGTYSVTVTSASGCTNTCTKTVNPSTSSKITGNDLVCSGQSTDLCAPTGKGYTYKWSTGATTRCVTVGAGTHSVTVTNASGCQSTGSKLVKTGGSCYIVGELNICKGLKTELCAPASGVSFKWSNGATTRCITVGPGRYTVTITRVGDCSTTCSVTVKETSPPTSTITGSGTFCKGGSTSLCAPSGTGYTYKWNTGSTSSCITVTNAGTFSVTVTKNGCVTSTSSKTVTETPTPVCSITGDLYPKTGANTTLCAPSGTGYTYQWSTGATTRCITVGQGKNYTVTVTNSVGCSSSCTVCVTYPYSSARKSTVEDDTKASGIIVNAYPNPFSTKATIEFQNNESDSQVLIELYDATGNNRRKLFDSEVKKGGLYKIEVNGDNLRSGVYIYRIITGKQIITKKLLLLK